MDDQTFDRVTRIFGATGSRRTALRALLAATPLALLGHHADAKKKKGKKKKKKKRNNQSPASPPPSANPCPGSQPDLCGETCVDIRSDNNHCGRCGNACPTGEQCVNGNCSCGAGSVVCEGKCVPGNCCNSTSGETCATDETCCAPNGCKNLKNDPENCGGCGQTSFQGEECTNGLSVCREGIVCGGLCQPGNCCVQGTATNCDPGLTCCGDDGCKNTAEDMAHCGGCGQACTDGADFCESGVCGCKNNEPDKAVCPAGVPCSVDGCICISQGLVEDPCGACGTDCPDDSTCDPDSNSCKCKDDKVFFNGTCEPCGHSPLIGLPKLICSSAQFGDYCSCGGKCCSGPGQCFVTANASGQIVEEYCCDGDKQSICDDQCCESPTCDGSCPRQTARYISYRRPGR